MTSSLRKEGATIRRMFGSIAPRYDLLNHLLSAGLDIRWRRAAARALLRGLSAPTHAVGRGASSPRRAPPLRRRPAQSTRPRLAPVGGNGYRVLDLCAGTLDLSCALSDSRRFDGKSVALDFALPMLRRGRHKLGGRRARQILPVCADGLRLPLRDTSFDAVMVAFGVRNLEDLDRGLAEVLRVLAPGGRFLVLEFSKPSNALLRGLYGLYNKSVLPAVGGAISGHPEAYRYLPDSVANFTDAPGLSRRLAAAGFDQVHCRTLSGGIVALHEGRKPAGGA
jgi:demethylmenaquinone methyltransferase/2-methoxy-6-polyprenyl-1,4-benzoquinol methylase